MRVIRGEGDGAGVRIAIVAARFHEVVTTALLDGALAASAQAGVADDDITVAWVPGAFEIPQTARALADTRRYDAIIALGVVIRGGTPHFDYVCRGLTDGLRDVMQATGVPVAFGVLTTDDVDQALERAGGKDGHKGVEAVQAALEMAHLRAALAAPPQDEP